MNPDEWAEEIGQEEDVMVAVDQFFSPDIPETGEEGDVDERRARTTKAALDRLLGE